MNIVQIGCADRNFRVGRFDHKIEAVVIHIIDGSQVGCDATFLDNSLEYRRSAHYSVGRSGIIHQYVQEEDTAFHAGKVVNPTWSSLKRDLNGRIVNPNLYTIGIEHEGRPNDEWTNAMYIASGELLRAISRRHPNLASLSDRNIVLHRQIRADKSCPGYKFDLARLLLEANRAKPYMVRNLRVVDIKTAVNLRLGQPNSSAPVVRVIVAGSMINVVGHVTGQEFQGNNKWYQTLEDDYFWAGATNIPSPA